MSRPCTSSSRRSTRSRRRWVLPEPATSWPTLPTTPRSRRCSRRAKSSTEVAAGIDLAAPEVDADPHSFFHALRAEGPVHWSDRHRGWLVVSHAAVNEGFRAPWLSSERMPVFERVAAKRPPEFARVVDLLRGWMVFRDPPVHERLRDPVRGVFTPMRLERLTPMIEATTDELLDDLVNAGGGSLQAHVTRPLPALVIADLLGVPRADRAEFQMWSDQLASVV